MGGATSIALARELSPLMTGFLLAARAGSAITAELSTMKVNEQIDAMEAMAVEPIHYLVVPRVIAGMVIAPLLCGLFTFVGVLGAFVMGVILFDVDQGVFFDRIPALAEPKDVFLGLQKAVVFGGIVTSLACRYGLSASGGAKGVGQATTTSVVMSLLTLLGFDAIITYLQLVD